MAQIEYNRKIMEKEKQKQMSQIENEAHLARITSQADADYYLMEKQAESNKVLLRHKKTNPRPQSHCGWQWGWGVDPVISV